MNLNIASIGTASQSSYSKWSLEDDAQRAVKNDIIVRDYSFHTAKEEGAFWCLDLKTSFNLKEIVIWNRIKLCQNKAEGAKLQVAYGDDCNWVDIVDSLKFTNGKFIFNRKTLLKKVRFIRIKNKTCDYLHLSKVDVFVADNSINRKKINFLNENFFRKTIVAQRRDGLGVRLHAILRGLKLSESLSINFKLKWCNRFIGNADQSIDELENIFSKKFIDTYVINEPYKDLPNANALLNYNAQGEHEIPFTSRMDENFLKFRGIDLSDLKEIFSKIEFSEKITETINDAKKLPIKSNPIGLHIRGGDVINNYRKYSSFLDKVIPYPFIFDFIESSYSEDNFILFIQDINLRNFLKEKYKDNQRVCFADQLTSDDYDRTQQAFFEIILMSRCKKIIGGESYFSLIASKIGQAESINFNKFITKEKIYDLLINEILKTSEIDPSINIYYAYLAIYLSWSNPDIFKEKIFYEIIKKCQAKDQNNEFFKLLILTYHIANNEFIEADTLMNEWIGIDEYINAMKKNNINYFRLPIFLIFSKNESTIAKNLLRKFG